MIKKRIRDVVGAEPNDTKNIETMNNIFLNYTIYMV